MQKLDATATQIAVTRLTQLQRQLLHKRHAATRSHEALAMPLLVAACDALSPRRPAPKPAKNAAPRAVAAPQDSYKITLLPGGNVHRARRSRLADGQSCGGRRARPSGVTFDFDEQLLGEHAVDAEGTPPGRTRPLGVVRGRPTRILMAAIGGPKWDKSNPRAVKTGDRTWWPCASRSG